MAIIVRKQSGELVAADPTEAAAFGWKPVEKQTIQTTGITAGGRSVSGTAEVFVDKKEEKPTTEQLEAKEIQRVKAAGGGYMVKGSSVMKIAGDVQPAAESKEVIKVPVKGTNQVIQIPISKGVSEKVAAAGGWDAVFNQANQQMQQRELEVAGRNVIYKAVQLAAQGKGDQVMRTPEEEARAREKQLRAYNYAFEAAKKPIANPLEFFLYGFYDPFGMKSSLEAASVRARGGTKEQALEAAWKAGRFGYEYQKATDTIGFSATIAAGAGSQALIAVAPTIIKYPVARIGLGTASIFSSQYQLTKEMIEGKASFPSTMLYLGTIGLASAGIYSGFTELQQRKLVDPVLKELDVKEYQKIPAKKYVPKYGEESKIAETNMERLRLREFTQRDILGKPTDQMPQIKDYDKAVRITYRHQEKGGAAIRTITFKQTSEGWKPVGRVELDRYFPDQKRLFKILDQWGSDQNININRGFVEKFIMEPTNKLKIFDWNSKIMKDIVKVEWVGIEKPETFQPLIKEANIKSNINWDVYRSLDMDTQKKISGTILFGSKSDIEALGIKDLTRVPEGRIDIDIKTGEIQSHAVNLALKPQPELLDVLKIEKPVAVDMITINRVPDIIVNPTKAPDSFQTPIIFAGMLSAGNKRGLQLSMMKPDLDLQQKQTPVNIQKIEQRIKSDVNQLNMERVIPAQSISPVQAQANVQKMDQKIDQQIRLDIQSISQPRFDPNRVPEKMRRETFDIDIPTTTILRDLSERGFIKQVEPKEIRAVRLALPTASFYSLEKAAAEFGMGSLARGKEIEKIFRKRTEAFGLAEEFPAAEFIKIPKKKKRRKRR